MGLGEWIKRKMEETRMRNEAKHNALKEMYNSEEYKTAIRKQELEKMKENKGNPTGEWLKRVSNNAANSLANQRVSLDKEKLFGKK